jgi:hypothetical protein
MVHSFGSGPVKLLAASCKTFIEGQAAPKSGHNVPESRLDLGKDIGWRE